MSKQSGHSKGPWTVKVDKRGDRELLDADGNSLMGDTDFYPWAPDKNADWDLIRSAPELLAALKKAEQLATIASDWNLDEVEIDNEMVSTLGLRDEFKKLIKLVEGKQ